MSELRKPFYFVAFGALLLAWMLECGTKLALSGSAVGSSDQEVPGIGISYLATLDALLVMTMTGITLGLFVPEKVQSRVQGIAMLIVAALTLLSCIVLVFGAITLLLLMLGLLLNVPFGTAAYLSAFGGFPRAAAGTLLASILFMKLVFGGGLVVAHLRFLENRSLVVLTLVSLVCTLLVGFMHGLVPGFLVSITDAVAGIVIGIVAAVYAILYAIGSLRSVWRALRIDRAVA